MGLGNVLVIGNSGVGKSTLINAVLGENVAYTSKGIKGTTECLDIYTDEDGEIPFRLIDSVGFEPSTFKRTKAVNAVKKWSSDCAKEGMEDHQINLVWLCVDGTSGKVFPDMIKSVSKAIRLWKDIPVIVVITKSYSMVERKENIDLVHNAMANTKGVTMNLKAVVPVVAQPYVISDTSFVAADGIDELILETDKWMPEGLQTGGKALSEYVLNKRRGQSQAVIGIATTAAATVGAIPIPFADAALLVPTETAEVTAILNIYGLKHGDQVKGLIAGIVEAGTISTAARAAVSGLKAIPYVNVAASVINAVVAGVFAAAIGESTVLIAELITSGKMDISDVEQSKNIISEGLSKALKEKGGDIGKIVSENSEMKDVPKLLGEALGELFGFGKKIVKKGN